MEILILCNLMMKIKNQMKQKIFKTKILFQYLCPFIKTTLLKPAKAAWVDTQWSRAIQNTHSFTSLVHIFNAKCVTHFA